MNIILNNYCNLNCKYCFAKGVMSKNKRHMTMEDFNYSLDFLKQSSERVVKLLGGEPTLHPNFNGIIYSIKSDSYFEGMLLFTNGYFDKETLRSLKYFSKYKELYLLINLNHPDDIGKEAYNNILDNIKALNKIQSIQITLSLNIYKKEQDFKYFIDVYEDVDLNFVRWSLSVPTEEKDKSNPTKYIKKLIPTAIRFIKETSNLGLSVTTDCFQIPICLLNNKDLRLLALSGKDNIGKPCSPIIDVKPNLKIIRCFALDSHEVDLKDFSNIEELRYYFSNEIDKKQEPSFDKCKSCASYKKHEKSCVCLAFGGDK